MELSPFQYRMTYKYFCSTHIPYIPLCPISAKENYYILDRLYMHRESEIVK
jgi:hypothetical protein